MNPLALVVENDANTRRLLEVLLTRFGFDVDPVGNGADALLLLPRIDYDATFLDLALPGASGHELIERLAARRPEALERVAVVSSASKAELERVRRQWPGVRTIRKPFELGEIVATAQEITSGRTRDAGTPDELFTRRSIALGAKAGVVALREGDVLQPVATFGVSQEDLVTFAEIRVDDPYPLSIAARDVRPVWLTSFAAAAEAYPDLAPLWQRNDSRAFAAVPLLRDGRLVGAAGWAFREPHLFAEPEQRAFLEFSELVARNFDRAQSAGATGA
ncbi:MAG: response regulator [Acidobacteria bacterium]|nr:response regulator [Acidobacteriota bacterium]MBV9475228.1 response regulator [Acidobacteriota bacterium]